MSIQHVAITVDIASPPQATRKLAVARGVNPTLATTTPAGGRPSRLKYVEALPGPAHQPAEPLAPVGGSRGEAPASLPDRGVYPLYDTIVDLGGATTEQLARRTGLPRNLVVERSRRLRQLGLVRFTGVGETRMWLPTAMGIARDAK